MGIYYISNYSDLIEINENISLLYNYKIYNLLRVKTSFAKKIVERKGQYLEMPDHININKLINAKVLLYENDNKFDYKNIYYQNIKKLKGSLPLSIRFVASYDCNEYCEYCLIKDIRSKKTGYFSISNLSYLDKLMEMVNVLSPVAPFKETNVTLIGGEPTLQKNWSINKSFLDFINANYYGNNHTLITNGVNLTTELLAEFKDRLGKEVYLSYNISGESYKNSEPTQRTDLVVFKKLCFNILEMGLDIIIDLKISPATIKSLDSTFIKVLTKLVQYDGIKILCSPIVDMNEYNPLQSGKCDKFDLIVMKQKGLINIYLYLKSIFKEKMIWPTIDEKMVYRCNTTNLSSLCFYPDGKVTTCGRLYAVSSSNVPIIADLKKKEVYKNVMNSSIYTVMDDEECTNCKYIYICGGKCYFSRDKKCKDEKSGIDILKKICKQ